MRTGAVILNYNSSLQCCDLANNISKFISLDHIVVVDNNSVESERKVLMNLYDEKNSKIDVIFNKSNVGYAAGNNVGLRYLIEKCMCEICYIVNPDVILTDSVCKSIADFLEINKEYAIVSAIRTDINGQFTQRQYWSRPKYWDCVFSCFWFYRRLLKNKQIKIVNDIGTYKEVEVVPGSFFAISSKACNEIDYLDEETFLYNEEICLSHKIYDFGYKEALILNDKYIHNHIAPSIKKDSYTVFLRGYKSKKFYIYKYILPNASTFKRILLMVAYKYCLIERFIIATVESLFKTMLRILHSR